MSTPAQLPRELIEYINTLQGVSLNGADELVALYDDAMNRFVNLDDNSIQDPDMLGNFADEFQALAVSAEANLQALTADLNLILAEGSAEWQSYAVPLLTEAQSTIQGIYDLASSGTAEIASTADALRG
jgi:hypothetical protein